MLAVETGWTPDVLASLPAAFRDACHWLLYARALSGPDGLPDTEIPSGLAVSERIAHLKQNAGVLRIRSILYPEDGPDV